MYQAVIIEDDPDTRDFLKKYLIASFSARQEDLRLETYPNGESFCKAAGDSSHYDIFFLDIEMPGINGLALASRIRTLMPHALIVFISGEEQWVFQAFEVQPFRFIRKQDFLARLPNLTEDLLARLSEDNRRIICLTEPGTGDLYSFDIQSLLYAEAQRKDCRLVSTGSETILRCPFRLIREQLRPWHFLQCHRSYLVNWRAIYQIGRTEIRLTNGEILPLSSSLSERIHKEFLEIVGTEI